MPQSSRTPRAAAREAQANAVPGEAIEQRRLQADTFLIFARLHRYLERAIGERFTSEGLSEVTPAQANLLMILFQERAPLTARALAERMGLSQVTVGRFVHALEAADWVSREPDPDDARARLIRPTRKAMRALPRFIRVSNELLDAAFAGFDGAAIRRIARTTERLRRNLETAGD